MILYFVKRAIRKYQRKADWRDITKVRRGFERIIARYEKRSRRCSYQPVQIGAMPAEWIVPKAQPDTPKVLLYFHGGGYATGSVNTHRGHISQIVKTSGVRALLINYRLAPEDPYPAAIEDAVAAYQWLLQQGYRSAQIAFGGDSAGGGLTVGSILYLRDNHIPLPKCAIAMSPWLDLTLTGDSMTTKEAVEPMIVKEALPLWAGNYLNGTDPRSSYVSPIFADLHGLPPMYIQVGTEELLLDDSVRFAARAKEQGLDVKLDIYKGYFHVFQGFYRILYQARIANKKLGEFLLQHLDTSAVSH